MNAKEIQRDILFVFIFALMLIGVVSLAQRLSAPAANVNDTTEVVSEAH